MDENVRAEVQKIAKELFLQGEADTKEEAIQKACEKLGLTY